MRLETLCALDLHHTSDFHLARPYGNESGSGWGNGDSRVTGERLSGSAQRSNQPTRRGDGATLPLPTVLFETEDDRYDWLNNAVCVAEGIISAETLRMHMEVYRCLPEI